MLESFPPWTRWLGRLVAAQISALLLLGCTSALQAAPDAAPRRIVAIGDLHGDLNAARAALRLAGAIDGRDRWVGGELILVQTGDLLDRGDEDVALVYYLLELEAAAKKQGGRVVLLNGNHELMNAAGDYRYVSVGGFAACRKLFTPADGVISDDQARTEAFGPGGRLAKRLAGHDTIAIVDDTVFVHGGILPTYVDYGVERINRDVGAWLSGAGPVPPWLGSRDSPIWYRGYSAAEPAAETCAMLEGVLRRIGVERMVVGHTVQPRITSACDGRIWRIDVGLAAHYGGPVEVLEIQGSAVRRLAAD